MEIQADMNFKNILCCTDFSEDAEAAFKAAISLAQLSGEVTVTLLHVIPEPDAQFWRTYIYEVDEDVDAKARRDIDDKINSVYKAMTPQEISLDVQIRVGRDFGEIMDFIAQNEVDIIVLGHRGHSTLHDMFAGNVSERIVRHAPCPVLIIPSNKSK